MNGTASKKKYFFLKSQSLPGQVSATWQPYPSLYFILAETRNGELLLLTRRLTCFMSFGGGTSINVLPFHQEHQLAAAVCRPDDSFWIEFPGKASGLLGLQKMWIVQ